MPLFSTHIFAGAVPKISARILSSENASEAVNCDLAHGNLAAMREPLFVQKSNEPILTMFKHSLDGWLVWDKAINVVKSAVIDADCEKPLGQLLMTGLKSYPCMYLAGGKIYRLGIPRPAKELETSVKGGAAQIDVDAWAYSSAGLDKAPARYGFDGAKVQAKEGVTIVSFSSPSPSPQKEKSKDEKVEKEITRSSSYCYTLVQSLAGGVIQYESAPSPPSKITDVYKGDGVVLSGFSIPKLSDLKITHVRIYRTVSGNESASFRFLIEIPVEKITSEKWQYTDTLHDRDVSAEVLQTSTWDPIPDNAKGLIKTDNGIYAAFRGNELLVSEPFCPYAFPAGYALTVEDSIVALGHVDGTIVVLTKGRPYLAQGTVPESLQLVHLPIEQACVSAQSVGNLPGGVVYASPDGLMLFTSNEQSLLTERTFTREQWQTLNPSSIMGSVHNGKYVAFFCGTNKGLLFSMGREDVVSIELPSQWKVTSLYHHSQDDALYAGIETPSGHGVWQIEAGSEYLPYRWRSKKFYTPMLCSMAAVRVEGDQGPHNNVKVEIYGPDETRAKATLYLADTRTKRLPYLRAERLWSFQLTGTSTLHEIRMAGSAEDIENGI